MGSLTDYSENALINHTLEGAAYTPVAAVYLALYSGDPLDTGAGGTEAAYTNYARQAITFGAAASRQVAQSGVVTFPQSGGGGATYDYYAVFDAASNGNMLAHGALNASINVVTNNTPSVASGQVVISINAGAVSDYLANKWVDFMFRNQAFAQPNVHVALTTAVVGDSDTGSTITEPAGGAYARVDYGNWSAASGGSSSNAAEILFADATASWGTIVGTGLCDALTLGNMLFYDNDNIVDQAVGNGDTVKFNASSFSVTLA